MEVAISGKMSPVGFFIVAPLVCSSAGLSASEKENTESFINVSQIFHFGKKLLEVLFSSRDFCTTYYYARTNIPLMRVLSEHRDYHNRLESTHQP